MRMKKEPLHRLPGVFHEDEPALDLASVRDAMVLEGRAFADRMFVTDPDNWYLDNYHGLLRSLKREPGIKLRIPVSDLALFRAFLI